MSKATEESAFNIRIGDSSLLNKRREVSTSAGCYIVRKTDNNEIELLVLKKLWPDGKIRHVLPGGHKEWNESLEETALREAKEESGYTDTSLLRYLGSSTYELDWNDILIKTDHYFLAVLKSEIMVTKKAEVYEEGVEVVNEWHELDSGLQLLTFENNPEINKQLRRYIAEEILE